MSNPVPEDSIPSTPSAPGKMLIGRPGEANVQLQSSTPVTNLTPLGASPRDSLTLSTSTPLVPKSEKGLEENVPEQPKRRTPLFRRPIFWFAVAAAVVAVVLVVILPVYFTVIKPKNSGGDGTGGNGSGNPTSGLTTGGDGSTVTTDNGTEFTYQNSFGGFCAWSLLSSMGIILQLKSQGFGIRRTRSMTTLSRIRGRLLSIRRGSGELTNSTGKYLFPSYPLLSSHVFPELFRHAARL